MSTAPFPGLETNARPHARGELNSIQASGSSDLTSPVASGNFKGIYRPYRERQPSTNFKWIESSK